MNAFPEFMKNPANRIAKSSQATPGVEGHVFDGADEGQMAFWTCTQYARSAEHAHEFDCYTLLIAGKCILIKAGDEYLIPRGVHHGGEVMAGTRTIHVFGRHRADREGKA